MYRHLEKHFGITLEPSPNDVDVNRLIQVQIISGPEGLPEEWRNFGVKFPAAHVDDLLHALQRIKKVLDTECLKSPEGYWPRRRIF